MNVTVARTNIGEGSSRRSIRSAAQCGCNASTPRDGGRAKQQRGRGELSLLPAFTLLALPKCPLCFAAWFGILCSTGANSWLRSVWGTPLAVALLALAIGSIGLRAWRIRDVRPLLLGTLGALALFYGKCIVELSSVQFGGMAMLVASSIWSNWRRLPRCDGAATQLVSEQWAGGPLDYEARTPATPTGKTATAGAHTS